MSFASNLRGAWPHQPSSCITCGGVATKLRLLINVFGDFKGLKSSYIRKSRLDHAVFVGAVCNNTDNSGLCLFHLSPAGGDKQRRALPEAAFTDCLNDLKAINSQSAVEELRTSRVNKYEFI